MERLSPSMLAYISLMSTTGTLNVEVPLEPERPGAGKGLYALLRAARRVAAATRAAV